MDLEQLVQRAFKGDPNGVCRAYTTVSALGIRRGAGRTR
jgi:hypothetical protein